MRDPLETLGFPLARIMWEDVRQAVFAAWLRATPGEHVSRAHAAVLEQIARLAWWHARHTPNGRAYCVPSEAWLAEHVGRRRETVSRIVTDLAARGLLWITHRRPVHGRWQTNLYHLAPSILLHLTARRRVSNVAPQLLSERSELTVRSTAHAAQAAASPESEEKAKARVADAAAAYLARFPEPG